MKYFLTQIFILLFTISYGQVSFNKIPLDKQLIGRNLNTNLGVIIIEGVVNNSSNNYDSIEVELYRNNVFQNSNSQTLNYTSNIASFNFNIPIIAELANYSIKVYSKLGITSTLVQEVVDIVAGDAFIIQGQSNAEATLRNGSANSNQNNFIRVFASGASSSSNLVNNNEWFLGQGDGFRGTNGNTGQWGLKLAKSIVESTNIPVAIFNGAHGANAISFFLAPDNYQTSQESNYGRLYFRLNKTGLKNYVRGVFWSQGERDADNSELTSIIEYKDRFNTLRNSWLTDYQNIEKIYIFQTKNGCNKSIENLMQIKEAQRQLGFENSDIFIIPTAGATHHTDNCHFPYTNGYELFSDRVFPLVQRDLYGVTIFNEIAAPMITNAYLLSNGTTLIVETDATSLSIASIAENFELSNSGSSTITNITTSQNNIIFTLSENPGNNPEISYLAQYLGYGNFITNTNNLELICFYKYPINTYTLSNTNILEEENLKIYPNPSNDLIHIKLPINENKAKVKLFDFLGRVVFHKQINSNDFQINLPYENGFYLLIIEGLNKKYIEKILKK